MPKPTLEFNLAIGTSILLTASTMMKVIISAAFVRGKEMMLMESTSETIPDKIGGVLSSLAETIWSVLCSVTAAYCMLA